MNRIYKVFLLTILALSVGSCTAKFKEIDDLCVNTFNLVLSSPASTKVTLNNPLSLCASDRLWKWEEGDVPSVILNQGGKEIVIPVTSSVLDADDPSIMKVNVGEIPSGSVLKGASFGAESAFGKSCSGCDDIPSSMVYARATFSSIGSAMALPDLTLKHQCSYIYIVPDFVGESQMTSFTIEGNGLKGGTDMHTIRLSFKDSEGEDYIPKWVAVSNSSTDITIKVSAGGNEYVMAELANAGKGRCCLYYVRNKTIGVEY